MAEAIQREVTREVSGLLQLVFQDCRKSGQFGSGSRRNGLALGAAQGWRGLPAQTAAT